MEKRLFILLITLIILTSAFVFPSTVSAAEAVYDENGWVPEVGDIDGDGNVATLRDLMCLARYLDDWEGYEDIYVKAADLNGDGLYATLADMYYLERYLAKRNGYTFGVSTEGEGEGTTLTSGETLPLYARFDFGTNTKAENLNYTTHEWLVNALSFNMDCIDVEFTEDSVIVTALRDHGHNMTMDPEFGETLVSDRWAFSLTFNDIISYDFDNFLMPGFGSWANAPYVKPSADTRWVGKHQYMQIRMRNFTNNNIISVGYSKAIGSFSTTQIASALYLQGGEPATADKNGKTAPIDTDWKVYTYDMNFQSHICRNLTGSYAEMVESVVSSPNGCGSNNWNWFGGAGSEIVGLRFDFLGGQSRTNLVQRQADYYLCDTREFITRGDKVEVDYVIFGSSIKQLDMYRSYAEESSLYGDTVEHPEVETTAQTKPEETTVITSNIVPEETTVITSPTAPVATTESGIAPEVTTAPETSEIIDPTVMVDKVSANPNDDQVTVNISLYNNPGLTAMQMQVYYGDGLTLNSISFNPEFGAYVTAPEPFTNPQGITFLSPLAELAIDGIFATLTFDIADDVAQGSVIDVEVVIDQDNTYDEDFNDVNFNVVNGYVGIKYIK